MRDDPLCLKTIRQTSHRIFKILLPIMFLFLQPAIQPCPKILHPSTAPHHQPASADMFASRKRGREDGDDDLQQYAPDTKVSAVDSPWKDRIADQLQRDQRYPSVPHPTLDTSALSHNHEADLHPSSHKPSRPQIPQRKRIRRPSNLQIKPTNLIQPSAPALPFKESQTLTQTWT